MVMMEVEVITQLILEKIVINLKMHIFRERLLQILSVVQVHHLQVYPLDN